VPVPAEDVSTPMRNMRQWLDDLRFNPSCFTFKETRGHFGVGVGFNVGEEGPRSPSPSGSACSRPSTGELRDQAAQRAAPRP
jgi:hypothetical protein